MTDHKFTDEENILLLLKRSDDLYANAKLKPEEAKTLLDLINRQKAENERLQNKVEELSEVLSDTIRIRYAECKAEAIKEFAERLIDKCTDPHWCVWMSEIEDLVTEMTENKR